MSKAPAETPIIADGAPTLASTRNEWISHLRGLNRSPQTIALYLRALDGLDRFLTEQGMPRALRAIRREHLEAWMVAMQDRGLAPSHVSILFRAVRPFFGYMVDEDELDRSPMDKMRTPAVPFDPPKVLDPSQVAALLAACRGTDFISRRDLALLSLMLDTGLRRGEVAGLTLGDLNVAQRTAYIASSTSKSRRGRAIVYGDSSAKALLRYLRHPKAPHAAQEPLWRARTGLPLTGNEIYHTLRRRAAQVGLVVHPHQLRHTWADAMLKSGHNEGDVMQLGGWASRQMLDRYGASVAAERARDAYRSPVDRLARR
ncbi:MAG: tyrosine-type recombinase/integrase [Chloroflexota bacterium]